MTFRVGGAGVESHLDQAAESERSPLPSVPRREGIVFLGMNPSSDQELEALKRWADVQSVVDQRGAIDVPGPGGRRLHLDLTTPMGVEAFACTLRIDPEQKDALRVLLLSSDPQARDELAQLARIWSRAERGLPIPSRLVLSGHSLGDVMFGENNGVIRIDELAQLAQILPRAAGQIEDLHMASCYSGYESELQHYRSIFPNLRSVWAYAGSAPGSASGAIAHLQRWERETRGAEPARSYRPARGTRKGENVVFWRRGEPQTLEALTLQQGRAAEKAGQAVFDRFRLGRSEVANPQEGPLRDYYNQLQRLLFHPDLSPTERPELMRRRDQTLRLLYYATRVAPRFEHAHADSIEAGFGAMGLPPPDFGVLGRAKALEAIEGLKAKATAHPPAPTASVQLLALLDRGLVQLDPSLIPAAWL